MTEISGTKKVVYTAMMAAGTLGFIGSPFVGVVGAASASDAGRSSLPWALAALLLLGASAGSFMYAMHKWQAPELARR